MIARVTKSAELSIKDVAKRKSEVLYNEIESVDLIAKEFRYRRICNKNFTQNKTTNNLLNETMISDQEESASTITLKRGFDEDFDGSL